eukprot:11159241-Lingulodinium_polyedra.AAC.1
MGWHLLQTQHEVARARGPEGPLRVPYSPPPEVDCAMATGRIHKDTSPPRLHAANPQDQGRPVVGLG